MQNSQMPPLVTYRIKRKNIYITIGNVAIMADHPPNPSSAHVRKLQTVALVWWFQPLFIWMALIIFSSSLFSPLRCIPLSGVCWKGVRESTRLWPACTDDSETGHMQNKPNKSIHRHTTTSDKIHTHHTCWKLDQYTKRIRHDKTINGSYGCCNCGWQGLKYG